MLAEQLPLIGPGPTLAEQVAQLLDQRPDLALGELARHLPEASIVKLAVELNRALRAGELTAMGQPPRYRCRQREAA